jgi:hypothetical protein
MAPGRILSAAILQRRIKPSLPAIQHIGDEDDAQPHGPEEKQTAFQKEAGLVAQRFFCSARGKLHEAVLPEAHQPITDIWSPLA